MTTLISPEIKSEADALALGLPIFKFVADMKAVARADGAKRVHLTASSNATDLVGDVMSEKALRRMQETAVGKTMFLNHDTTVPESVFGVIVDAQLVSRTVQVTTFGEDKSFTDMPLVCLEYDVVVEESNPRAIKTWEIINGGRVQLGASVTIAVLDKTKLKDSRTVLEDVYHLETSVVGVPCNQTAWLDRVRTKSWAIAARKAAKRPDPPAQVEIRELESSPADIKHLTDTKEKTAVADEEKTGMEALLKTLSDTSEELTTLSKAGARNSAKDKAIMKECHDKAHIMHDSIMSLGGVECAGMAASDGGEEAENGEEELEDIAEEKSITFGADTITYKTLAELEAGLAQFKQVFDDLNAQQLANKLELEAKVAQLTVDNKTLTREKAVWKARYATAVTLAEEYAKLPAARPGQAAV